MELSELTAYAREQYHMEEERRWAEFPGLSVLNDPESGKWAALLMREWDPERGREIQLCDLRRDSAAPVDAKAPWITAPFRMRGRHWLGVRFDSGTEAESVFRLFDRAVTACRQTGYTFVLDSPGVNSGVSSGVSSEVSSEVNSGEKEAPRYRETALPLPGTLPPEEREGTPAEIRKMMRLYEYGDGSFRQKCRNFYLQGMFMKDYEDNRPWYGEIRTYFPVYHDLRVVQLRGYFTWRTGVRRGTFQSTSASFACIYLYELLNGIGTESAEDGLQRLLDFEAGYLEAGFGDSKLWENLRRWKLEYAVIRGLPPETVRGCQDPETERWDEALSVLKAPRDRTDREVFLSLCRMAGEKVLSPSVGKKEWPERERLIAEIWRYALERYDRKGSDLFTACFGERKEFLWHPLANAVYWDRKPSEDRELVLNAARSFHCRSGVWRESCYRKLFFDRKLLTDFLHEADRRVRLYLKIGRPLRERPAEGWAAPFAEAVLEADRQEKAEAAKPRIVIDLSGLDRIRSEAGLTRDSLLTEEELAGELAGPAEETGEKSPPVPEAGGGLPDPDSPGLLLDPVQLRILQAVCQGRPVRDLLSSERLMASVVTDDINERLYDRIGDNILECEGDEIRLVEDYREEAEALSMED